MINKEYKYPSISKSIQLLKFIQMRLHFPVDSTDDVSIDVKNVFYVFYFKIKNAFFNVFYFPNVFIDKKRWAFLFLYLTTTFSSLVHIQIICTWTLSSACMKWQCNSLASTQPLGRNQVNKEIGRFWLLFCLSRFSDTFLSTTFFIQSFLTFFIYTIIKNTIVYKELWWPNVTDEKFLL